MTFRESVFAKTLDLLETALGEIELIAIALHAFDKVVLEFVDRACVPERRHGPAQFVGLGRTEFRRDDGDLHCLFLEERHALGPLQDIPELILGILNLFQPVAATQVGMHHAALDRARAYDSYFDHKVVELPRLESW